MRRTLVIIALLISLTAGCSGGLPEGVIYPSITLDRNVTEDLPTAATFDFEGQPVTLSITVDGGLYAGAVAAEKSVTRFGNARENDWIEDYFPAFVDEEHQDGFYDDLLAALRQVRESRGLDADRYAELLVVFAQSITYKTDPVDLQPKFPVETFVDGNGDCDDKTLLLAGLLSREGYDVAVLMFEPEKHVALGLRSTDIGYLDTGYAYTETTAAGFIGMVPDEFAGGVTLTSEPRVFRIGTGSLAYTAGDEVRAILDGRQRAVDEAADLLQQVEVADSTLAALEADVRAAQRELEALRAAGRISEYNAGVPAYNALVGEYNSAVKARNALTERHNVLAELDRAVLDSLDDRRSAFATVNATMN